MPLFLVFQQERWILQPWASLLLRAILELRPFQCLASDHQGLVGHRACRSACHQAAHRACHPACYLQVAQACHRQGPRGRRGCRECPD